MPTLLEVTGTTYPQSGREAGELPAAHRQVLGQVPGRRRGVAARRTRTTSPGSCSATARSARATGRSAGSTSRSGRKTGSSSTWGRRSRRAPRRRAQHPQKVRELVALWDDIRRRPTTWSCRAVRRSRASRRTSCRERSPVDAGFPPLIYKRPFMPPADSGEAEILIGADPKPRTRWETRTETLMNSAERSDRIGRWMVRLSTWPRPPSPACSARRDDVVGAGAAPLLLEILSGAKAVPLILTCR